jgi:kinetochor protein Mis14/NSL1
VPVLVVEGTKRRYMEGMEGDEEAVGRKEERVGKRVKVEGVLGVEKLERQESVEWGWRGAVEGLQRVLGGMPGVVARCERAGKAEGYVVGMEGK